MGHTFIWTFFGETLQLRSKMIQKVALRLDDYQVSTVGSVTQIIEQIMEA